MSKKISDILPKTEILAQLAEEASELAQAALAVLWPVGGADSASLCAGLPTKKCTSRRLKECSMSAKQKDCRATGRPA